MLLWFYKELMWKKSQDFVKNEDKALTLPYMCDLSKVIAILQNE